MGEEIRYQDARLHFFRVVLPLFAVESWDGWLHHWQPAGSGAGHLPVTILMSLAAVLVWGKPAFSTAAFYVGTVAAVAELGLAFPDNANHHWLQFVCLAAAALVPETAGAETWLRSIRLLGAAGLFWAGLTKVLYGYYFHGVFFAYAMAHDPRFADFLADFDRPRLLILSNLAYLPELILPPLFLWRRTRTPAVIAATIYIVGIEFAARELYFGILILALFRLWLPPDRRTQGTVIATAAILVMLLMVLGVFPRGDFT